MIVSPATESAGDRDERGRFRPGNAVGRSGGNPMVRRLGAVQAAIADAFDPADVVDVLASLRDRAIQGDTQAAVAFVARVAGPARQTIELDLPMIRDASSLADAVRRVVAAVAAGELDVSAGERVLSLVTSAGDAVVLEALEQRVAQLEGRR